MGDKHKLSTAQRAKERRLQSIYKQTLEDHNAKLAEQNFACAVCKRAFREFTPYQDHDHACCPRRQKSYCGKCNRGLLCFLCNKKAVAWLEYMRKVGIDARKVLQYIDDWTIKIKANGGYEEKTTKKTKRVRKK